MFKYRSTEEEMRLLPPHDWPCPFVIAGNGTSCEIKLKQQPRKYKGRRFYDVCALVIKQWLNRVDEDASGEMIDVY